MRVDGQMYNAQLEHEDNNQTPEASGKLTYNKDCESVMLDLGDDLTQLQDTRHDPVGVIKIWGTDTPPPYYLLCNGDAISRVDYADLFATYGVIYGSGDGITTFNLPDYRGLFLRATDYGRGLSPGGRTNRGDGTTNDAVGTRQAQQVGYHTHTVTTRDNFPGDGAAASANTAGTGFTMNSGGNHVSNNTVTQSNHPINININLIIKVK